MIVRIYNRKCGPDVSKLEIVKLVKSFTGLGLKESKQLIDPIYFYLDLSKSEMSKFENDEMSYGRRQEMINNQVDEGYGKEPFVDFEILETNSTDYNQNSKGTYTSDDFFSILRKLGWDVKSKMELRNEKLRELGL